MTEIPELTNDEWAEYLERLTLYAAKRFTYYGWIGNRKKNERIGPKAMSPQDLAANTIINIIEGKRLYNPEAYPNFMAFLCSAIDSQINNLSTLVEHKRKKSLLQEKYENNENTIPTEIQGNEPDPSRSCMNKELVEMLKMSLAPDFNKNKIMRDIFDCMEGGITKRREIAQLLDVNVKEVDNARKRLYRKIREISCL